MENAIDKLIDKIKETNNPTVIGLDPRYDIIPDCIKNKYTKEQLDEIKSQIEYKYNFNLSTITPTKTSVSEIKNKQVQEQNLLDDETTYNITLFNKKNTNIEQTLCKPQFLNKSNDIPITATQKGTLIHMCMQRLNPKMNYDENAIKQMLEEMCLKNIISVKEKDAINQQKILNFLQSDIWKELRNAKMVCKEKPFYIEIKADNIIAGNTQDNVLVQGIIDLYYINNNDELVLVDYKTDYVEKNNEKYLVDKYKKQLELYKFALENALHRKVDKTYIYSVFLEKKIDIA